MTAPPFAYYGGKTTLAPQIADLLPSHEHYVEPFAGSLAVLLAKTPSRYETVNDLDGDLMTFWRVLRDQPDVLAPAAMLTPHSRAEFEMCREIGAAPTDVERARRVWVRLTQGRVNALPSRGWRYRRQTGSASMPEYIDGYADRMPAAAQRLKSVSLECRDAVEVIRDYGTEPTVCLYVDPPYLGSTRATGYRHEMTGDDQHHALADALNDCQASVVLSGYDSPLYAGLFDGWHRTLLTAPTALSGEGGRVEVLWSNRPLGQPSLFDGIAL
jgi:DNA adenine methylase